MSKDSNLSSHSKNEHGTTWSYVIGFILSLIYTFLPYQLVVNKVLTGNALLAAILGIAIMQMVIQLLFFLHLGRGPKPLYNVVFFFATASIIIVTVGASLFIMNNLYHNMSPEEVTRRLAQDEGISQISGNKTGACSKLKGNHIITINNGLPSPAYIKASLCDTLTFVNEDDVERELTFAEHPAVGSYGGEFELHVSKGRPETITLNEAGEFTFHDHINPDFSGRFLIEP
jgi:cytochrome o ubiquinol oxidase operon protein cyoD